jgi:uncharacterized protein YggE
MDKSVTITLIIAATILLVGAGLGMVYWNSTNPPSMETVSTNGQSTVKVSPDIVGVYFNVETNATTSQAASEENAKIVDEVITALVKLGLERKDIQTTGFNVNQWQEWENNAYVDKGFKASHQIKVELKSDKFSQIGSVIDAGVEAGALINYINFELSSAKQNEYKAQAIKEAGADAKVKAQALAEIAGKPLGEVVSLSVNDWGYYPWPLYNNRGGVMMDEVASAKQAATNIQPGDQEVTASVAATYRIG